ncbi:PIN domain-containing protein [Candidatus Woesearchaeota archaeon]|nr:PIN domain-containing protein [Candidatus Woesearchaeota archaeon]
MYFFDTYALWELVKKNPKYEAYSRTKIICSIFNAYEFYVTLRREFDEATAKEFVSILEDCVVEISVNNVMEAVEMKKKYNKQDISFIDCLGYIKAKELGMKFLTGDKEFETMTNVEFVK